MNKVYARVLFLLLSVFSIATFAQSVECFDTSLYDKTKKAVQMYCAAYIGAYGLCSCIAGYLGIVAPSALNYEECYRNSSGKKISHTFFSTSKEVLQEIIPVINRTIPKTFPFVPLSCTFLIGYEHYKKTL